MTDFKKRIRDLEKKIAADANNSDDCCRLGYLYFANGEYNKSIEYFKKAITRCPESVSAHVYVGKSYFEKKEYEIAKEFMKLALDIEPENEEALYEIGLLYYYLAEYEEAIEYLQKLSLKNALHFEALFYLGHCYFTIKDFKEATYYYKQAFYVNPKNSAAYYSIALAQLYNNELEDGEKLLLEYHDLYEEENAKVYLLLAKVYSLKEYVEKALLYLRKAISINPILKQLAADSEFDNIRTTLEFQELM